MEEITFNSQEELYKRILPALRSKRKLLNKSGYKHIKEIDIWDFLRNCVWVNSYGLELCELVDDILHADEKKVAVYYHDKYMSQVTHVEDVMELPKLKTE